MMRSQHAARIARLNERITAAIADARACSVQSISLLERARTAGDGRASEREAIMINPTTGAGYSILNTSKLASVSILAGYTAGQWAGFNQWLKVGRIVRKGEHGARILMVCEAKGKEPSGTRKVCKSRVVFAVEQTDALQPLTIDAAGQSCLAE